jgi:hypothetical protein
MSNRRDFGRIYQDEKSRFRRGSTSSNGGIKNKDVLISRKHTT